MNGLILEYLKGIDNSQQKFIFHLITHEQREFALTHEQQKEKENFLLTLNIKWHKIKYRSGALMLLKKIFNFLQTFFIVLKINLKHKPAAILGFLSIAGGYSYILSKVFRLKLIVYCFEPHSEYMIDFKIWKKTDLKYKLLKMFERLQIKSAHTVVVPNRFTKQLLEPYKPHSVLICPISIDTNRMVFDGEARKNIRKELNAQDKKVIIYTGKFGGIYYEADEVIRFFKKLHSINNKLFFYIITSNTEEIKQSIIKYQLPLDSFHLSFTVSYTDLNKYISAADIGFVALPPLPSQKYRTPVKTAIYLSCGLPYLVNRNIGEDDLVAEANKVGVVIENLEENPNNINSKILNLLHMDSNELKLNCRRVAEDTRGTALAVNILNKVFSEV